MTVDEQMKAFSRGAVRVIPEEDLRARLEAGRPLRVKLGVDPTSPDIHLGHTVALTKLRQLQDMGHTAVLIIGDFTALIGDPSGRSSTRPVPSPAAVEANAHTYEAQVFKVLDPARTEVRHNREWFAHLTLESLIPLAAGVTVAQLLERDDFRARYQQGAPIGLHELLYPLMQAYDSVVVSADVEVGGTDQTFNLLLGRDLQRQAGQTGQVALVMPLLEGLDGVQKMSKSLGNHVGISDAPEEMFGKVMSLSDQGMQRYYDLLSRVGAEEIGRLRSGAVHPMQAKKALARELVARFHGAAAAATAEHFFEERFQRRHAHAPQQKTVAASGPSVWICQLVKDVGFAASTSEARRLVAQGAVRVDGDPVGIDFQFRRGVHRLLAVGRRKLAEIEFVGAPSG